MEYLKRIDEKGNTTILEFETGIQKNNHIYEHLEKNVIYKHYISKETLSQDNAVETTYCNNYLYKIGRYTDDMLLNVFDLIKNLDTGEFGDRLCDYDSVDIDDALFEIADNAVDIYTSDLLEWAGNNIGVIDEYFEESGARTFLEVIQYAQAREFETNIYEYRNDSLLLYCYNYITHTLKLDEITTKQNDDILLIDFDNISTLDELIDELNEIMHQEEEND